MNAETLIDAAHDLANVLARENALLLAVDLAGAARLADEKRNAADRFTRAQQGAAVPAARVAALRDAGRRLQDLAETNRRLLERAIVVQGRIVGVFARAIPRATPGPRYGARGTVTVHRQPPVALLARA